jgi:hypothetical protein
MHLRHGHQRYVGDIAPRSRAGIRNFIPHPLEIFRNRHINQFSDRIQFGMWTIILLIGSNIFMTFAWYGHLKYKSVPLWKVILISWGIALFEYCLQVPANRIGSKTFSPDQLKVIQEIITLSVFGVFSIFYFGDKLHWNHFAAFGCLIAGAFFMFHKF